MWKYRYSIWVWVLLLAGCGGSGGAGNKPVNNHSAQPTSTSIINSASVSSRSSSSPALNSEKMFRPVSLADQVTGFENPDDWSVSAGTKKMQPAITEGQQSLIVDNFQTLLLKSQPLNSLRAIGDQISIDLLAPMDASIEISLTLASPSLGLRQALPSSVPVVDLKSAQVTSVRFAIPAEVKQLLNQEYDDLVFELSVNSSLPNTTLAFDHLRFAASVAVATDKVEIEIDSKMPGDFAYLIVNGVQRRVWVRKADDTAPVSRVDITALFWQGLNSIRLQGINTGGYHSLTFNLWVNGEQVIHKSCTPNVCGYLFEQGIFYDSTFLLNTPNLPAAKNLVITGPEGSKIYVDDLFVAQQIPTQLRLPQGSYRIGVGEHADSPFNYRANFYERRVQLGDTHQLLDFSQDQPLGVQHTTRVAIVPIRNTRLTGNSRQAVLTDQDIELFRNNVQMANDQWVVPFSYGLQQWDINVLPTIENYTLEIPTLTTSFDVGALLNNVGMGAIKSQYEIIIVHYSGYDTNRSRIDGGGGAGASAGGGYIIVPNIWDFVTERPHAVILHEALHVYEHALRDLNFLYNGTNGLHGAGIHGYVPVSLLGEDDWVGWYRMFARSAVKETLDMRDMKERALPSDTADMHVGVFEVMRHGLGFLH